MTQVSILVSEARLPDTCIHTYRLVSVRLSIDPAAPTDDPAPRLLSSFRDRLKEWAPTCRMSAGITLRTEKVGMLHVFSFSR
jgi:hypothetical protein